MEASIFETHLNVAVRRSKCNEPAELDIIGMNASL